MRSLPPASLLDLLLPWQMILSVLLILPTTSSVDPAIATSGHPAIHIRVLPLLPSMFVLVATTSVHPATAAGVLLPLSALHHLILKSTWYVKIFSC